jgi:hypothetical protein
MRNMTPEESKMFAEFVRSEMGESPTMINPINDGGPAFPCQPLDAQGNPCNAAQDGMSLRDWFAGQFLTTVEIMGAADPNEISSACYKMADAMLAAREAK